MIIPESQYWILFANVALGLVLGGLCCCEPGSRRIWNIFINCVFIIIVSMCPCPTLWKDAVEGNFHHKHYQHFFSKKGVLLGSCSPTCGGPGARPCSAAPASSSSDSWEPRWTPGHLQPRSMTSHLALCWFLQKLEPRQELLEPVKYRDWEINCKLILWITWIQSLSRSPSFLWFDFLDWSAINRNMSKSRIYLIFFAEIQFLPTLFLPLGEWITDIYLFLRFAKIIMVVWIFQIIIGKWISGMRQDFYLQRYFSSRGPLHIIVTAILKERTRICPVLWLKRKNNINPSTLKAATEILQNNIYQS